MLVTTLIGTRESWEIDMIDVESINASNIIGNPSNEFVIERHFTSSDVLIGASVMSAVRFEATTEGINQLSVMKQGSKFARENNDLERGHIIPTLVDESHELFDINKFTLLFDIYSRSPEELLAIGYVASGLISQEQIIIFTEPNIEA